MRRGLRHLGLFLLYGTLGASLSLAAVYLIHLHRLPETQPWHRVHLDAEFEARDAGRVRTLDDYRRLEERLFAQLEREVCAKVGDAGPHSIERFAPGSRSNPLGHQPNWNRTFVLEANDPRGGVLLLHGLTDSPYSLRAIAEWFNDRGFLAVGLRLPGHGAAPSGLHTVHREDLDAAVRLGSRAVRQAIGPDKPLIVVGYSMGAALAVDYELARAQGEDLPRPAALILLSPAIGVSRAAALARLQGRLEPIPGLSSAAWSSILPEYDPYKFNSFAVNGAHQMFRITRSIRARLDALAGPQGVAGIAPILAFQSVADGTVSTAAVVDALFRRLAPGGHALVLFDVNRFSAALSLMQPATREPRENLLQGPPLPFDLTVLTNEGPESGALVALHRPALRSEVAREPTGLSWPAGVFSLSHVAVPFAPDDPIYGARRPPGERGIFLGWPEVRGERGVLLLDPGTFLRLRHNPFFPYVEARLEGLVAGSLPPAAGPSPAADAQK
ncbi:MAG: lysophospholipase [Acidobacteria bacterium]|nr:lysophospholipase [Acidobacteriota bacterium]